MRKALLVAYILCMVCFGANAQTDSILSNTVQKQLALYTKANPASLLFVHFDKTLYTNNDNIWFTAYLLNCINSSQHHTLSVSLVNDIDHTVVIQEKFIMVSGLSFGNLHLSDTIAPGNYTFMVYTNRMVNSKPEVSFTQPVTIKSTADAPFKAILSLSDTSHALYNKQRQVILTVNGSDYLPVANAIVNYRINGTDTTVIEGKAKTDKAGQYILQVPAGKNMVKVQVSNKKASQYLYLPLPHEDRKAEIKFYPEGGNLINNLPLRVGWEAQINGQPLQVQGILYEDDKAVDTIATNSYGMGRFALMPTPGKYYSFKLAGHTKSTDTAYQLPTVLNGGIALAINKALLNDTLHLVLMSSYTGTVYVNIHNYQQQFFTVPLQVKQTSPRRVKIALTTLPKGLAEITVTDSTGKPYAERIFFAHYDQHDQLSITTDKSIFNTRQKVTLQIKLNNSSNSNSGVVSVACVQDNRIELKKVNDIESYIYLKHDLNALPLKEKYFTNTSADKQFLEDVLLIKGWRRYSWTDLLQTTDTSIMPDTASVKFKGTIREDGKSLKKPTYFILNRDSSSSIIMTDTRGDFMLSHEQLVCAQDKTVRLMTDTHKQYEVRVVDPYYSINKSLARYFKPTSFEQPLISFSSDNFAVKGLERAIQLRAVTVKPASDRSLYGARENACGDYVCSFNILNCPNHRFGFNTRPPIVGQLYKSNGQTIIYTGCDNPQGESLLILHGIYESKQYYGSDYAVMNPSEPEYTSTIFWKHLVKVTKDKETTMSFYTSDITGKFRIVVQGITEHGVVYNESSITVKKP